jgi:hypothetical protein
MAIGGIVFGLTTAWLEYLVVAMRIRSLVLLFLLALVIVVMAITVDVIHPFVIVTIMCLALPAVATVTPATLFRDTADLLIVSPPEHLMHLTLHAIFGLMLAFFCKGAMSYLQVINDSSILSQRRLPVSTYFAQYSEWKDM